VSNKLQWRFAGLSGAFQIRTGELHLILSLDDGIDRTSSSVPGEDGFHVIEEESGKLSIKTSGNVKIVLGNSRLGSTKLLAGRTVEFEFDGEIGEFDYPTSTKAKDPNIGKEIGGYKLLGVLGSGAVGVVYRALQAKLDRPVALKVLNSKAAKDPLMVTSFKREAVSAGRLSHPNLVQIYDVGADNGLHFYSMEIVAGGTLEDYLDEHGPMPWREAIAAVQQCAQALAFAKENGLVHRDVKPENIMMADSGHIKLADLGLASTRGMIDQEAAGGTPHFMAPECAKGEEFDHRADLYSLGCTMFRLLTGKTVYSGDNVREILRQHIEAEAPSLSEHDVQVPVAVESLLSWLLSKNLDERADSAQEVVDECEEILNQKRGNKVVVGVVLSLLVGVVYLATKPEPAEIVDPKVVEVMVSDPEAEAREAELQRKLAEAEAKAHALKIENENSAPKPEELSPATVAAFNLESKLQELLASNDVLALIEALARDNPEVDKLDKQRLQLLFLEQCKPFVSQLSEQHNNALGASDWQAAELLERQLMNWAEACPAIMLKQEWSNLHGVLLSAKLAAQNSASVALLNNTRSAMIRDIKGELGVALSQFNFAQANNDLRSIIENCPEPRLVDLLSSSAVLLQTASEGVTQVKSKIANGDLQITHPATQKRAKVLAWTEFGIELEQQQNGGKVKSVLAWQELSSPLVLKEFLLQVEVSTEAADAWYIAVGSLQLGNSLGALDARGLNGPQFQSLIKQAELWAWELPSQGVEISESLRGEQRAMEKLAAFLRELNQGNPFEAVRWLEALGEEFSLLAAFASNGSSDFGVSAISK